LGYLRSVEKSVAKFSDKEREEEREILENILNGREYIFSASEIGIKSDYRGRGLGKNLLDLKL